MVTKLYRMSFLVAVLYLKNENHNIRTKKMKKQLKKDKRKGKD